MDQRQAKVTSLDALSAFRTSLVLYITAAGNAIDEVRDEVRRTRTWMQYDQRNYWEGQLKRLRKELEQAESELFTSRLSAMTAHSAARQMAVTRLRRKVRETEEKAKVLVKWIRNYDGLVEPLLKKLEGVQHLVAHDLPKAVAFLSQAERTLDDYARIGPEGGTIEPPGPAPEPRVDPGPAEGEKLPTEEGGES